MLGARTATCPNCGAPIAWQLASSHAAVCKYCQFSVVRTDTDLSALGRVADLVPTASPIAVGDEGSADGSDFRVFGRVQLDHGRGPWDEWYLWFADGRWGWLAGAQGRWYLTFDTDPGAVPSFGELAPGARITLAGKEWAVSERGNSTVVSAEGELPFAVDPRATGRFVDLEGAGGAFATLDFGSGTAPAKFFAGRELQREQLVLKQVAVGPRPTEKVNVSRLACPACGAPVMVRVPDKTERIGCAHCGALLDHSPGYLALLKRLEPPAFRIEIPLGTRGKLLGEDRVVCGVMQRAVTVEGERFTFREYLLYAESGYSWLVEDEGHWLHVTTVPTSDVETQHYVVQYKGRKYVRYAAAEPEVEALAGEFYWRVEVGDRSQTVDYNAPPRALSKETTDNEITWSEGEYVEPSVLDAAFSLKGRRSPQGVNFAQPNPHRGGGRTRTFLLLMSLWALLAFRYGCGDSAPSPVVFKTFTPEALEKVTELSDSFRIESGLTAVKVEVLTDLLDGTATVEAALVPEHGSPREVTVHAQGNGQPGGARGEEHIGSVSSGTYSMRFVTSWQRGPAQPSLVSTISVRVTVGGATGGWTVWAAVLLVAPYVWSIFAALNFETERNRNASA